MSSRGSNGSWLRLLLLAGLALRAAAAMAESTPPMDMKIFLLIGQSNMAGRGVVEAQDKVPHPRVFMLNQELAWVPAIDPMH